MKGFTVTTNKKWFHTSTILCGLAIMVLIIYGQAQAWDLKEAAKPYKGDTIRTIGEALPPLEALDKIKTKFTELTGIKVVVEQYAHEEAVDKVMLDLNARTGRYDFIIQPHRELGRFAENKHVVPLERFMNDPKLKDPDFHPEKELYVNLWKEISWYAGKPYGFPFTAITMFLWYRVDLVNDPKERAGFKAKFGYDLKAPQNWKEYKDMAQWFTRPDKGFYGTAIQGKRHVALWYEWLNFLYSFGGDVLEADKGYKYGPIIINSPEGIASLDYYKGLLKYSPSDTLNYDWDGAMAAMQQARIFECIMWNDATYAVDDPKQSTVAGRMGFGMVPQGKGGKVGQVEGWTYLIPRYSKHKEAAYLFIQWALKYPNQLEQHLNGGASPRPDVYAHPHVKKLTYSQAAMDTNSAALPKATFPESPQMTDIIVLALSDALAGKKSSKEALDWAALEIHKLLGDKAPLKYPVK
ncbi:MAG: ABC transporter substrate-binding protein [Planctomycetota bacterium]|jgi:multiple sugar transport system substrate-binding protein